MSHLHIPKNASAYKIEALTKLYNKIGITNIRNGSYDPTLINLVSKQILINMGNSHDNLKSNKSWIAINQYLENDENRERVTRLVENVVSNCSYLTQFIVNK
jgi:hypothetical protein